MTRDEILAMEAGPELDALVAIEVKRWYRQKEAPDQYICHEGGRDWISPDGEEWWCNHCGLVDGFPAYSTDIAAAWEVDKPEWQWHFFETPGRLIASIRRPGHEALAIKIPWLEDKSQTYAFARCRTALFAVMESDE